MAPTEPGSYVGAMFRFADRVASTLIHLCLGPWVGLAGLTLLSVGLSLTAAFAVTVVGGAFFLALTLWAFNGFARFERARAGALLGVEVAAPVVDPRPHRFGFLGRQLADRSAWRALGYGVLQPVVASLAFSVTIAFWCGGLVGSGLPLYIGLLPQDTARLLIVDVNTGTEVLLTAALGVLGLVAAPFVTLAAGRVDLALNQGLLGRNREAELRQEVVAVSARRNAAVDAADAERRRIERDLHDGAQQRLVSLGMTLGLAREKLDQDPETARSLIEEAHTEAKAAMTELRAIARGIHPAVLDDRGLDAALSALAARSPVPVDIAVALPGRRGINIEGSAYYVVAEALTNIAKHAQATRATVNVFLQGDTVVVQIADDGKGGATLRADGGLEGLRHRVAALGGTLVLNSPVGGPTELIVEFPCES